MNIYATKIPMGWKETKLGKIKIIEFLNAKQPKVPLYYIMRLEHAPGMNLSISLDGLLAEAIKKMKSKADKLILKEVESKFSGKMWVNPTPNTEVIVLSGAGENKGTIIFRQKAEGINEFNKTENKDTETNPDRANDNKDIVDKIIDEGFNMDLDGGFSTDI